MLERRVVDLFRIKSKTDWWTFPELNLLMSELEVGFIYLRDNSLIACVCHIIHQWPSHWGNEKLEVNLTVSLLFLFSLQSPHTNCHFGWKLQFPARPIYRPNTVSSSLASTPTPQFDLLSFKQVYIFDVMRDEAEYPKFHSVIVVYRMIGVVIFMVWAWYLRLLFSTF
jgi:hypothetical protein